VVDEFAETVERRGGKLMYEYGSEWRPVQEQRVSIRYRQPDGTLGTRAFTTYGTHHGPIIRNEDGKWVAFAMMDKPILALEQSYLRTKASDLASYLKVAERKANSSNNTLFADDHGEIAYLHPQFVPRRDDRFDYTKPVDGSDPATDWHGLHAVSELPNVLSPPNGWVDNNNNWPWSSAGAYSPKAADFPKYMDMWGENPRGIHAVEMLSGSKGWTLDKLQAAAFDTRQPGFERLVPMLVRAWDSLRSGDAQKTRLAGPIAALRGWDGRWSAASIPNTLGNFWGAQLWRRVTSPEWDDGLTVYARLEKVEPRDMLADLDTAVARLTEDFGTWKTPWGEINRFQRISAAIDHPFSDSKPSIPVPFSSARWGSLASFGAGPKPGTKKWYGTNGNSFVAVVEFGPRVNARAITAGGESGHPQSPHFNDEAVRYASGALRQVYFWPDQLIGHTEQVYRPGAPLTRQARP
ncbi:MAG TPA: penicillin acylase family protein, partial [Sphingomicrobium sp.]|nr:penicillin acylase family protein [Sphingomicrobium sp.]